MANVSLVYLAGPHVEIPTRGRFLETALNDGTHSYALLTE